MRNLRHVLRHIVLSITGLIVVGFVRTTFSESTSILLTADTEGHIAPCDSCPTHRGLGGLARRSSLLMVLRTVGGGPVLLLDAGNFLFGDQSLDSDGRVIVSAYNALQYDAVNLSYRDFRLGKDASIKAVREAKFSVVSSSLLDAATGKLLVDPYVVKKVGGSRFAVVGATESPAALAYLPRLKSQLAGVKIRPPADALAEWIPKAKTESDQVVLLYYGSVASLAPIRERFANDLSLILVGGARPDELPENGRPALAAAEEHGKTVARVQTLADGTAHVEQLPVTPTLAADPAMTRLIEGFQRPAVAVASQPATMPVEHPTAVAEKPAPAASASTAPAAVSPAEPARPAAMPAREPVVTAPATSPPVPQPKPPARVTAKQDLVPKGLEGVGLTADQVNAAIDRGAKFLWTFIQSDDLDKHHQKFGDQREHILAAYALVHAGGQKRFPDFDRALRAYLTRVDPFQLGTYENGLLCMLIESYGEPSFYPKQRQAARYLVEAEGEHGSWTYNAFVPPSDVTPTGPLIVLGGGISASRGGDKDAMRRLTGWSVGKDGDNSCSQFAILGIHSASRCQTKIASDVWQRNLARCRARQNQDGGWGYADGDNSSYGSMTCAGICALAIDRFELGEQHPELDEGIERGLGWMAAHFSVESNPQKGSYLYYYLYSLERVGRILDTEFIGDHEWYPLGAKFLVGAQKDDGRWLEPGDEDPRVPTSFALLFLTRATQKLIADVKHGGEGILKTDIQTPPPARIYIILDASGSMLDEMDGKMKFDVARDSVRALLERLPDSTQVALRVYGHRKRSIEPGSDEDTALEIPMGPIDRPKLEAKLRSLRSRGKTPLALSLTQAMSDLSGVGPNNPATLVLLTDGGEDTMPRRDPVKVARELGALKGVTFHIVGFDINQEDWGQQLRAMSDASGGYYWPAPRGDALASQLCAAVLGKPDGFVVLNDQNRQVAQGNFGQSISLPEGAYTLKAKYARAEYSTRVPIATDATTAVLFDASRASTAGASPPAPQNDQPTAQSQRRFCTHCGHALPAGAKFCPNCGQPVPQ